MSDPPINFGGRFFHSEITLRSGFGWNILFAEFDRFLMDSLCKTSQPYPPMSRHLAGILREHIHSNSTVYEVTVTKLSTISCIVLNDIPSGTEPWALKRSFPLGVPRSDQNFQNRSVGCNHAVNCSEMTANNVETHSGTFWHCIQAKYTRNQCLRVRLRGNFQKFSGNFEPWVV